MNVVCRWCLKGPQLSLMPNLLSDSRLGQSRPPDIRWLGQNIRSIGYFVSEYPARRIFWVRICGPSDILGENIRRIGYFG